MTITERIDTHLKKLGIAPVSEYSPNARVTLLPRDVRLVYYLRARGIDARYTQEGRVTVPERSQERAEALIGTWRPGNYLEDGRACLRRSGVEASDA